MLQPAGTVELVALKLCMLDFCEILSSLVNIWQSYCRNKKSI